MAAPALLARVVVAALKRYAPKYVGAALKILGVIEIADLAKDAYRVIFGSDDAHREAVAGYQAPPADTPHDLIDSMSEALHSSKRSATLAPEDVIEEEEILKQLNRAEASCADLTIAIVPPSRGRKVRSCRSS